MKRLFIIICLCAAVLQFVASVVGSVGSTVRASQARTEQAINDASH